ncbi:YaiI/YqxD family protein [Aquabacterium sp. A7-Y]|uniref:YaiI/YqxD family protein n=1 Tax=Aquabacterium sp. A7-Y TaxID=1349605 RepID=UPI00223E3059|nr:YaiI/YqxD family protein [Aquabacterium sp. A7-Y]MCW7541609.1 YaiI/YqxD family protein [Aquabacterium sp. A7-Y]
MSDRPSRRLWVDADACPKVIKDILFRAAVRSQLLMTLVANRDLYVPPSPYIRTLRVARGFDVADDEIARQVAPGDLVVTQDIGLAALVLARDAHAVSPRGEPFSPDTIDERLRMRDLMDSLRSSGIDTGGPSALSAADRQAFARQLDLYLAGRWPQPRRSR